MPVMKVILEEPTWPDLDGKRDQLTWLSGHDDPPIQIGALEGGMVGGSGGDGRPSVAIRIDLPDGRIVVAETSLRLFQMANAALLGRFGDVT